MTHFLYFFEKPFDLSFDKFWMLLVRFPLYLVQIQKIGTLQMADMREPNRYDVLLEKQLFLASAFQLKLTSPQKNNNNNIIITNKYYFFFF